MICRAVLHGRGIKLIVILVQTNANGMCDFDAYVNHSKRLGKTFLRLS